jgi:hypothetical protein
LLIAKIVDPWDQPGMSALGHELLNLAIALSAGELTRSVVSL